MEPLPPDSSDVETPDQEPQETSEQALDLPDSVTILRSGERTFYLVGTAHVSEQSVKDVEAVIDAVKPDTVCVELCQARHTALVDENRWKKLDIFKVIKEGKTLFLMANLAMGAYQRRLGAELGVKPGAEMLAAVKKAEATGAELCLADRDIHATLKRTWANVGFWRRAQLLGAMVDGMFARQQEVGAEDIEKLKEKAQLSEMMKEFARVLPEVQGPLIDERDQFLMSAIEDAPGQRIVAVVGAAHVEGMQTYLGKPIDRAALSELPPPSKWTKALKWIIPMLVLAAFTFGLTRDHPSTFKDMLQAWILPNSIMCALFTMVALAKPLSIVTAFIASPITSLNPLLPAGVVVGLVEAWLRKPTVADAERINEDVQSVSGVYRNQFTRVLLVAVMSTFGSAAGAWIGLGWLYWLVGQG